MNYQTNNSFLKPQFSPCKVSFDDTFPLEKDRSLLVYVGGESEDLNAWVREKLSDLRKKLKAATEPEEKYKIVYIPEMTKALVDNGVVSYNYPQISNEEMNHTFAGSVYEKIWEHLAPYSGMPLYGGFLRYSHSVQTRDSNTGKQSLRHICDFYQICAESESKFLEDFASIVNHLSVCAQSEEGTDTEGEVQTFKRSEGNVLYSATVDPNHINADDYFDARSKEIADEIKERIEQLRMRGIDEFVIQSLFEPQPQLSRLVIDDDFRIILPDFNNMEIIMEPLPKAVYFLFLRHPEGILFKNLPDHEAEFISIYKTLTKRNDIWAVSDSIERVLSPYNNSINEKCARIRSAFLEKMDDRIACHYYIIGKRGCPKYISAAANINMKV